MGDCNPIELSHTRAVERQQRSFAWAESVYGEEKVNSRRYQALRTLEEMVELVQTQGLTMEDVVRTAEWVFARKAGDTKTEIGDVVLSLNVMAENLGVSVDSCFTDTLNRVKSLDPEKCRVKDEAKVAFGLI